MVRPKISVVMSIFNEPIRYIDLAIESMINQTIRPLEIIVILDNPKYREAANFLKSFTYKYKNIKVIFNERNIGLGPSLNKGVKIAKGIFIARMDADDISLKRRLEIQYNIYTKYKIDILSSDFCFFIEKKDKIFLWQRKNRNKTILKQFKDFLKENYPKHPTIFLRRRILLENPYVLKGRSQDIELFWRLKRKGYSFFEVNICLLLYRFPYLQNYALWKKYIERNIKYKEKHKWILKLHKFKNKKIYKEDVKKKILKYLSKYPLINSIFIRLYYYYFLKKQLLFLGKFPLYELLKMPYYK